MMERAKLAALLDRASEGDEAAREALVEYIMQQPEGLQVLALEALEDGGDDTYEQLMLTLADDPQLVIRTPERRGPVEEGDADGLHPIAQQAAREWREQAAGGQAPQSLLDALRGGERQAQVQAARQLGAIGDPASVGPLLDAIRAGDRLVAAAAVEALQEIGAPAQPSLVGALGSPDEQVRWHGAKALSTIADGAAVPALIRALDDKNYGVRWLAAEGLVHAGRAAIVPLLRQLAEHRVSAWTRQGAWHLFNKLDLPQEEERAHFRAFAEQLKRASSATIPDLARQELRRLGQDA